ncbi:MAG TPA: PIN domain-containing protein, partial [Acidimicrobiia bacterium]|nr:PIN domain-containing protein [Acidimicrobiia bacterium]
LVLDTGPILALLNSGDPDHARCADLLASAEEDLVIPAPVIVEVDYWCRKLLGHDALDVLSEDIAAGAYVWFELGIDGMRRALEIGRQYRDLDLGYVDAAVVATCELLDEDRVVSLDRRHFTVVRPAHRSTLRVLPE